MSCKHTRDWNQDTYKKSQLFWQKYYWDTTLSHYQQCYYGKLTCNINKVCMFLLKGIYVGLVPMGLFSQLSPKEIVFLSQWKRYHKYQIYYSVSIVICVTWVYDSIPNIEIIYQICSLTVAKVWKLLHLDGNNNCWSYLMYYIKCSNEDLTSIWDFGTYHILAKASINCPWIVEPALLILVYIYTKCMQAAKALVSLHFYTG